MKYACTLSLILILFGCSSLESRIQQSLQEKFLETSKKTAVQRGIRWLADKNNRISAETTAANLKKIYKATPDEKLAAHLADTIRKIEATLPPVDTDIDLSDEKYCSWFVLRPKVEGLLRRKCIGQAFQPDTDKIKKHLRRHWSDIFPPKMILSQKLVAAYLLEALGVCSPEFYRSVVTQIRSRAKLLSDPSKPAYLYYLYALTHTVFTRSDYYSRYLDKSNFDFEINGMTKAIDWLVLQPDLSDNGSDILAEMLICLKLLKIPPEARTRKAASKLLEKQNPDGSWGSEQETPAARTHHTVVAVLALMEFAPAFRPGKIYCPLL